MKLLRVGAAVLNQTPLDWDGNCRRIGDAIRGATSAGVSVLCLPEMCLTGYGCEDAFHAPGTQQMALQVLQELLPETRGLAGSKAYDADARNHSTPERANTQLLSHRIGSTETSVVGPSSQTTRSLPFPSIRNPLPPAIGLAGNPHW